jgi:polar amino acid transport system substrate-binding protein
MGVNQTSRRGTGREGSRAGTRRRTWAGVIAAALVTSTLVACSSAKTASGTTGPTAQASPAESSSASDATTQDQSSAGSESSAGSGAEVPAITVTVQGQEITTDATLASQVPAPNRASGVMNDISYNNAPPDTFVKDGELVGWEIDLGQAVAAVLGLKWQATASGAFDSFIPGLQNGRYDVSFTSFIQTPERLKQIDIVTYFDVGTGFAVKAGSGLAISKETDVCGHSVAVLAGSAFIQQINSIKCADAGLEPVKVQSFPSDAAAELAVSSGRAEVYSSSLNQLEYLLQQTSNGFEIQPLNFMPTPQGAGVTKGTGLAKSVGDAMDYLIKSGAYAAIMKHWGLTNGLVTQAKVYADGGS